MARLRHPVRFLDPCASMSDDLVSLFEKYKDSVYRQAASAVDNGKDAEDVTQEVFLVVMRKFSKIDHQANVEAWLSGVTRLECLKLLRNRHRYRKKLENFAELSRQKHSMSDEERQHVIDILGKMDPDDAELLRLRYRGLFQVQEIAKIRGVEPAAMRKRLERLRTEFERLWNGDSRPDDPH